MLPHLLPGAVSTVSQCQQLAFAQGYDVVGLEDGGQCFAGMLAQNEYYALGRALSDCSTAQFGPLGGALILQVYTYAVSHSVMTALLTEYCVFAELLSNSGCDIRCVRWQLSAWICRYTGFLELPM